MSHATSKAAKAVKEQEVEQSIKRNMADCVTEEEIRQLRRHSVETRLLGCLSNEEIDAL